MNSYNYNMNSFTQFVCLSGLPRTGSTLLSAILSQNPDIHAEGNSAVCQLMWDTYVSCSKNCDTQLKANHKQNIVSDLLMQIPHIYYKGITESIVVDKCRSWALECNVSILRAFMGPNIKIIIMERSVVEIMTSFAKLYTKNGMEKTKQEEWFKEMLKPNVDPITRSIAGINWARKQNDPATFLFIQYHELIEHPQKTMDKIYKFCNWKPFVHQFDHINVKYAEENVYGFVDQHFVRPELGVEKANPHDFLSDNILRRCELVDKLMNYQTL